MLSYVRYYTRPQEDTLLHKNRLNTMLYEMHFFLPFSTLLFRIQGNHI
jgi:hypothetical protein